MAVALLVVAVPSSLGAPPSNDNFASATVVTSLPFSATVVIADATTEPGEPLTWGQSRTIWYAFTPTADVVVRANLDGSNYVSAFLAVYRADSSGFDLAGQPREVLEGFIRPGQHVDAALEEPSPQATEPALHLHAQIVRLGRELVDQAEPRRSLLRSRLRP